MAREMRDKGTENVLVDLGFPDAEQLTAKAVLAKKINDIIEGRRLSTSRAAAILKIPRTQVSAIHKYKLKSMSLERLMHALTCLGQHVEIVVSPADSNIPPRIDVAA